VTILSDTGNNDPDVQALSEAQRRLVAISWTMRSQAEGRAAAAMQIVAGDLRALNAPAELVVTAERSVVEERGHAQLCSDVALAYDANVTLVDDAALAGVDEHEETGESWHARHIIGFCCISETFASAHLNACRARATTGIVRAALQRLLSDEVHHAQLGWAFLASPAAPARTLTTGWLVPLLEGYREYVVRRTTAHPAIDLPAHGCASPAEWLSQYLDVVEQLILPGFEHVGVSTDRARDWLTGAKML